MFNWGHTGVEINKLTGVNLSTLYTWRGQAEGRRR